MLVNKISADIRLANLYISPRFEELFGKTMAENLLREFNEANPDIRVRILPAQTDKNQPEREPDIIIYDNSDSLDEAASLAPLNSYIENDSEDIIFAIPLVSFMDVLFYNINILSAAGFDRPPRTRGEYIIYSRTVQDSGIYTDDLSAPENNKPEKQKLEDFVQGNAALITASTRAISFLRERLEDNEFSLTSIPTATDGSVGRYNINLTGIYAGIGINSANSDAAWSFIEFLTEKRALFCEMFQAVPGVISDIIPGDYVNNDPFYSKAWDIFEYNKTDGLLF
ncbi:MAG: extracellular solute-binding protein [Treponema sp.]|nr:extracellular solute-binding protein [Treponema sp.]